LSSAVFDVSGARFRWKIRNPDLRKYFCGLKCSGENVNKEFRRRNSSLPFRSLGDELCIGRQKSRRQVSSRIRVARASTTGPKISDLLIADLARRIDK